MGLNRNHPKKGSVIKVQPIKSLKDIRLIKRMLQDRPRDLCLFTLGINTNLRAGDILNLKVGQVLALTPGQSIQIREKKTKKMRSVVFNSACVAAINAYLDVREEGYDAQPLFMGQRGPLTVSTVNNMVKSWCSQINLRGNYGSHTLRKTWGYHQRVTFGVDLPTLMVCFNHSSQRQTLDYLCIDPEEIRDVFANEL